MDQRTATTFRFPPLTARQSPACRRLFRQRIDIDKGQDSESVSQDRTVTQSKHRHCGDPGDDIPSGLDGEPITILRIRQGHAELSRAYCGTENLSHTDESYPECDQDHQHPREGSDLNGSIYLRGVYVVIMHLLVWMWARGMGFRDSPQILAIALQ